MNEIYLRLSYWQVGSAALLILINASISLLLQLELGNRLLVAAMRATVQLLLVGFVLQWIFAFSQWYAVLMLMVAMTLIAGTTAVTRTEHRYSGVWLNSIVSVGVSSWLITAMALLVIVRVEPWYTPQYAIPFMGMILGNTLSGISLGLDRFSSELDAHRDQVEALLALGATRWEAARGPIRGAIRTGTVPILNSMTVAGLVSLPGVMTGQLLAGVPPVEAAKYQIVILFLIASGTALGTVGIVLLSYRYLFNADHQFVHSRMIKLRER